MTPKTPDLGPMPEPEIEPKEPNPGGVDAIEPDDGPPAVHDLDPADNPAVEESAPDELSELEDTETQATMSGESGKAGKAEGRDESPA